MKLKSFFKRLILTEEKIVQVFSPINGEILVYEDLFGKYSMRIGGVSQSGGLVVDIWKKAIEEIRNLKLEINKYKNKIIKNNSPTIPVSAQTNKNTLCAG